MKSRMTIVEALDERDLLVKKIESKIKKLQPVALTCAEGELTWEKLQPKGRILCAGEVCDAADTGYDRTV